MTRRLEKGNKRPGNKTVKGKGLRRMRGRGEGCHALRKWSTAGAGMGGASEK